MPVFLRISATEWTEYTGEESLPGACTLQPRFAARTSQNATTLCRAVPAAMWHPLPPPAETS